LNHTSQSIKLSDYAEDLLILDFWAKHCGSCVVGFYKLDSLRQIFGSRMKVLLVNSWYKDDEKVITEFLKKRELKWGKRFPFPTAIQDSVLRRLFPYREIPHYIWIYNNKVVAITSSTEVTAPAIHQVLNNEKISVRIKKDQDKSRPLFVNDDLPLEQLSFYSMFLKGHVWGISGFRNRINNDTIYGRVYMNQKLLTIYDFIARNVLPGYTEKSRIIDSSAINELKEICSYEFTLPPSLADSLYPLMLKHLNTISGVTGKIEPRKQTAWILETCNDPKNLRSKQKTAINRLKDSLFLQNGQIKHLVLFIYRYPFIDHMILDHTGIQHRIDMHLPPGIRDIESLQRALARHNLKLTLQECAADMFILSKNHY